MKRLTYMFLLVLSTFLLFAVTTSSVSADLSKHATSYYHTKANVPVKAGKHRNHKTLVTVAKNKTVKLVKREGSWAKVQYGKTTGYVPFTTIKPVPVAKGMMRPAAEKHLAAFLEKKDEDFILKFDTRDEETLLVDFKDASTIQSYLYLNMVDYTSMHYIEPEDFGQEAYDLTKQKLAVVNSAIKRYAETQFGIGSQASKQFIAEMKKTPHYKKSVYKTILIGGKEVSFEGGIGAIQVFVK